MKKLVINRPRKKEKFYNEGKLRIYVNGIFEGKLKQNEKKEVDLNENTIEVQFKSRGYRSQIKKIDLTEKDKSEITTYISAGIHPIQILFPSLTIYVAIMLNLENNIIKYIASAAMFCVLIATIFKFVKIRKDGITVIGE